MATMRRRDFDTELRAWLDEVRATQDGTELYADLWLANGEAKAIKDPRSPAYDAVHQRMNAIIERIEAL
jgi:hypothetical protein